MRARRLGFILFIAITFTLGWFFNASIAAQSEERESYKKEVQEKLKDLDKKIDELQGKASEMKGEAKTEFTEEMSDLRRKQKAAKKEWTEVKHAAANKWDKIKADMDAAVQDAEGAYDKAVSRLKEHKD